VSEPVWGNDWAVGLRIWIERQGQAILGKGRAELLSAIDRTHSISAAARDLEMSYRRAWLLVQAVNQAAGETLVEAAVGGKAGGGARLTARGRAAVATFLSLQTELRSNAAQVLPRILNVPSDAAHCVHLAAAISLQEVLGQLLTEYALLQPQVPVRAVFGASNELADYIQAGSPANLFVTADAVHLDRLEAAGLIAPKSRKKLASNSLTVLATDEKGLRIRRPADLLSPRVTRVALAEPVSPLGKITQAYLQEQGVYELLLPRVVHVNNSRAVIAAMHSGQADVGLAFSSDTADASGCRILFRADSKRARVDYTAAIISGGPRSEESTVLMTFLRDKPAKEVFRRCGFVTTS